VETTSARRSFSEVPVFAAGVVWFLPLVKPSRGREDHSAQEGAPPDLALILFLAQILVSARWALRPVPFLSVPCLAARLQSSLCRHPGLPFGLRFLAPLASDGTSHRLLILVSTVSSFYYAGFCAERAPVRSVWFVSHGQAPSLLAVCSSSVLLLGCFSGSQFFDFGRGVIELLQ
jgi:hypothetical protein